MYSWTCMYMCVCVCVCVCVCARARAHQSIEVYNENIEMAVGSFFSSVNGPGSKMP